LTARPAHAEGASVRTKARTGTPARVPRWAKPRP